MEMPEYCEDKEESLVFDGSMENSLGCFGSLGWVPDEMNFYEPDQVAEFPQGRLQIRQLSPNGTCP